MVGKGDLVGQVASTTGLTRAQATKAVDAVLETISESLARGENVSLSGFGTFRVSNTAARQGRNPATGAAITIPAGKRIGFSAGSRLSSSVKGGGGGGSRGGGGGGRGGGGGSRGGSR